MNKHLILSLCIGVLLFSCTTKKVVTTETAQEKTEEVISRKDIDLNLIAGDYYITSVDPLMEFQEVTPTIKIEEEGRISGNNGCNSFFGQINLEKEGKLLANVGSTRRACQGEGEEVERLMMEVLNRTTNIKREGNFIIFYEGDIVLLTAKSLSLELGTWQVFSLDGKSIDNMPSFEVINNRVNGNTGCNSFFAMVEQNGSSLQFIEVGMTEMDCPDFDMSIEAKFSKALSEVTSIKREGENAIFYNNGKELFRASNPE